MEFKEIIILFALTFFFIIGWRTGSKESGNSIAKFGFKLFGGCFSGLIISGILDLLFESTYIKLGYKIFGLGIFIGLILGILGKALVKKGNDDI